jgi:hypothetical protein
MPYMVLTRRVYFLFLFPPHPETTPATIHARACSAYAPAAQPCS